MLLQVWGNALAIDLGTANTRVWARDGRGMVREASSVAYLPRRGRVMAVGAKARDLAQRQARSAEVVEPIKRGAVAEFNASVALLRAFVSQALDRRPILSPAAVVSAPAESTGVEYRALRDAIRAAGISRIHAVAKSLAAGVGGGVPVDHAQSILVVDLGAGITEISVMSSGMLSLARSLPFGGVDLDEALRRCLRRHAGVQVSRAAAEDIKLRIGSVDPALAKDTLDLSGMVPSGVEAKIAGSDLAAVLAEAFEPIVEEVQWVIEQVAPKEWAEIEPNGVLLCGGGALLRGLPELFASRLGIRATVAEDPLGATVLGLSAIARDMKSLSADGEHLVSMGLSSSVY